MREFEASLCLAAQTTENWCVPLRGGGTGVSSAASSSISRSSACIERMERYDQKRWEDEEEQSDTERGEREKYKREKVRQADDTNGEETERTMLCSSSLSLSISFCVCCSLSCVCPLCFSHRCFTAHRETYPRTHRYHVSLSLRGRYSIFSRSLLLPLLLSLARSSWTLCAARVFTYRHLAFSLSL